MKKRKVKKSYVCQNCGHHSPMWTGQCPECREWNTLEENLFSNDSARELNHSTQLDLEEDGPKICQEISSQENDRVLTGIREFDRVLGGGIIRGSLVLIGGEPGIGKSTLLTNLMGKLCLQQKEDRILYVSGEESFSKWLPGQKN